MQYARYMTIILCVLYIIFFDIYKFISWKIFQVYIYIYLHSFTCWWTQMVSIGVLWIMNMGINIFLWDTDFVPYRCISRSRIATSYCSSTFTFWRKFHSSHHPYGCINIHCTLYKVPFSLYLHQLLITVVVSFFLYQPF